jgi:hypothetical protein
MEEDSVLYPLSRVAGSGGSSSGGDRGERSEREVEVEMLMKIFVG